MPSVLLQLSQRVEQAMAAIGADGDALVRLSQDEQFGDYQSNVAMGLAKRLSQKPRDVAAAIIEHLRVEDMAEPPEIAGPGFINFRLHARFLAEQLQAVPPLDTPEGARLGIEQTDQPQTVVVDLSSPNLAKEMHVGHLRSTVIGDCIARILEFQGHTVYRENHVGDWGTQFGMLLAFLRRTRPEVIETPDRLVISDLETFYVEAKTRFDSDEPFREESRKTVVALQSGDDATRRIWRAFCEESLRHCHAIYDRLGVRLIDRGESFYTDLMTEVLERLEQRRVKEGEGFVALSDGALCLFMDGFKRREGEPLPLIVRKSDGGFNYATSDLATIVHRVEQLKADRIIYVVGLPQRQHFQMVFAAVRQAGWVGEHVSLEHIGFGNMLGADGRPFKTREGGTVKLKNLLDEAVARAKAVVETPAGQTSSRDQQLSPESARQIAETVGISAVKYYDLSHALNSDYRFDLDTMISLEGNTAPYMLYACARIRSIGRKAGLSMESLPADVPIVLEHPAERALAKKLVCFPEILDQVGAELRPNLLTEYLFELSKTFSRFYDRKLGVRVVDASPESLRNSRLRLCELTAATLKLGLGLLGIETLERM